MTRKDPIRRLIIPAPEEASPGGIWIHRRSIYTRAPGCSISAETALLLVSDHCCGFCRYCFRKRIFIDDTREVNKDISGGLAYIRAHPEITNVLLTGGDPLVLDTARLREILARLREIEHVRIIRIVTKMLAYDPYRIINDPGLLDAIREYSLGEKSIYIMAQFNHPRELTEVACRAVALLQEAGAVIMNQTPLIRGINDDPVVLSRLLGRLSFIGVNPTMSSSAGPRPGTGRLRCRWRSHTGYSAGAGDLFGALKQARFVMSHATGKIEVVGMTDEYLLQVRTRRQIRMTSGGLWSTG